MTLVRWGREGSYYPDETALVIARYLASLGVTLVIGDHPTLKQDHAYIGDTLVIFSLGSFFRPSNHPQLCWQQVSSQSLSLTHSHTHTHTHTHHCMTHHRVLRVI